MAALTPDQLRSLLRAAGFKANSQTESTMVGIAYAESGGNPSAYNGVNKDSSYGLWQINMKGALGPARRKQFGIANNDELFKPDVNARAAYSVYKSQGLAAWSTYRDGKYLKFMDGMSPAEGGYSNPVDSITDKANGAKDAVTGQFDGIASSIDSVGTNLFKGLASGIGILVALVLLVLGVVLLVMQTKAGKGLTKQVRGKLPI